MAIDRLAALGGEDKSKGLLRLVAKTNRQIDMPLCLVFLCDSRELQECGMSDRRRDRLVSKQLTGFASSQSISGSDPM